MFFASTYLPVCWVFWLIAKHMNKQRITKRLREKVSARLKKIGGKAGEV